MRSNRLMGEEEKTETAKQEISMNKSSEIVSKLEKEGIFHTALIAGSGSSGVQANKSGDFWDGFRLWNIGSMDDRSKIIKLNDFGVSSMESSSPATLKRTRGLSSAIHAPSCLVDGCRSDLSKCRDYHRRHKVCELHSKTPKVTIAGQEQRFCQQCSRFHSLGEFDEEKRSCRKRLDGHNRRRRKPQPEPLSINSGRFLSSYQGSRFSPFHSPQMYPSAAMTSALAMAAANSESDMVLYNAQSESIVARKSPFPGSVSHSYTAGKEISFLQSPNFTLSLPEASLSHQSFMDSNTALNNCGGQKMFSEWLHRDNSVDSNCALSLLSSTPTVSSKETVASHHMVQSNSSGAQRAQSLVPSGLSYYSGLGMVGEPLMTSALVSDDSENTANLHCQEMFRIRPDGSSSSSRPHRNSSRVNHMPP